MPRRSLNLKWRWKTDSLRENLNRMKRCFRTYLTTKRKSCRRCLTNVDLSSYQDAQWLRIPKRPAFAHGLLHGSCYVQSMANDIVMGYNAIVPKARKVFARMSI